MAVTQFAFSRIANPGTGYIPIALADANVSSEQKTPSASNQQTTVSAPLVGEPCMCSVATDTAVYVAFGSSPDATNTALRFFMPANTARSFVVKAGDKAAVAT
jgi:hypothetical protein